jgi:hypothetical protein
MADNKARIKYLEGRLGKTAKERKAIEDKYFDRFSKYATYKGNGVYEWRGILSTDTRELFLMGALRQENISFKEE